MRLDRLLSDSAGTSGDRDALVAGRVRRSYAELDRQSNRLAAALLSRGMADGDRVVIFLDNSPQAVVAIFAVFKAGGVAVPVEPGIAADELAFVLDHCQALAIVTQARLASVAATALARSSSVRVVVLSGGDWAPSAQSCLSFEEVVARKGPLPPRPAGAGGDDCAAVRFYAPVSVGMIEPVIMTHGQVMTAMGRTGLSPPDGDPVVLRAPAIVKARALYRLMAAVQAGVTLVLECGPAPAGDQGHEVVDRGAGGGAAVRQPVPAWDGRRRPEHSRRPGAEAKRPWRA